MKALFILVLSSNAIADEISRNDLNRLLGLLTEQYASLLAKSITQVSDERSKRFTISQQSGL